MTSEVLMLRTFVVMYSRTAAAARSSKEARHSEQKDKEASYTIFICKFKKQNALYVFMSFVLLLMIFFFTFP